MLEGFLSSIVAKAVYSVTCAFGLFGGLAVTGVLPVIGDNAADTVALDAIAVIDTPDQAVAVNPYVELSGVPGIGSQLPAADTLTGTLPDTEGLLSNGTGIDTGLPPVGLVGTLVNSLAGTVDAVLGTGTLPAANEVTGAVFSLVPDLLVIVE